MKWGPCSLLNLTLFLSFQVYRVAIFESTNANILQVVLAGTSSNHTNLLTPTRLYCATPRIICRAAPLRSDAPIRSGPFRPIHKHALYDNSDWKTPCGHQCPAMVRKSTRDKGIASFLWNPQYGVPVSNMARVDYLLAESLLCWRFSRCRNVACPNYQPVLGSNGLPSRLDSTEPSTRAATLFWSFV